MNAWPRRLGVSMGAKEKNVTGVDPRYVREEVLHPVYRVDFWDESRACYENWLENAVSIDYALARAEADRHGRYVGIWAELNYEGGLAYWLP
ncbi:hypothetical protein [Arthrobacter glacialis]|nr:hypothetical protein [Arthrobacter glacialis]